MPSLLRKVKSRLFVPARRHALHQLDGQYRSQARGRGADFDDLREYAPGDDVRDIDWNATARTSTTLVRRYNPERKQLVMFVVDTGRSMAAVTRTRELKRDLVVTVVGALAYMSTRHGDDVALLHGDGHGIRRVPVGRSDAHLERMLRAIDGEGRIGSAPGDMGALVAHAARTLRRRAILVCVSDEAALSDDTAETLRALRTRHDLVWVGVGDSTLTGTSSARRTAFAEVATGWSVPQYVLARRGVLAEVDATRAAGRSAHDDTLDRIGVPHALVHSEDDVLAELIGLLSRRGYARG